MSLFRIAVVLSLGVAVMPSDKAQQDALYERAATAAHWTMTYCERNGSHCVMAGELWDAFLRKAEFAGKLAYDVALRSTMENATAGSTAPIPANARGTLNPADLQPSWRGERAVDQGGA
jgi:hypothetical protein